MMKKTGMAFAIVALSGGMALAHEDEDSRRPKCHKVDADLVEDFTTTGCNPGEKSCYLGEAHGRFLHGTSHFVNQTVADPPSTSPGWVSYSGLFTYTDHRGDTITFRETGLVNVTSGNVESLAQTSVDVAIDSTGALAGAGGYLFINGSSANGHVVTVVTGNICLP